MTDTTRTRKQRAERLSLYQSIVDNSSISIQKLAEKLGKSRTTVSNAKRDLLKLGLASVSEKKPPEPEPKPHEIHDAAFWRRKTTGVTKQVGELQSIVRELSAVDGIRIGELDWASPERTHVKGSATLIVHNSDRHIDEVINPDEINGWNEYNPEIAKRRIQRFMDAACDLGRRWMDDTTCDGVLYTMGGDEISGDIHEELKETNAFTSLDAVQYATEVHVQCLRQLVEEYGRVHVAAVPGNHGRTTRKPTAKKYGALSYDIMIAKLVAKELRDDPRITWDIAAGPDVITLLYGRPVLITHGDKIGTGGGKGFAGPVLPIIRGGTQVKLQYGAAGDGWRPELILMGHYHTSANPPGIMANGSVPGMSEFGFGIRGAIDTPRQWLGVMRSRWGLSERCDVQLEEPIQPPKPKVRIAPK